MSKGARNRRIRRVALANVKTYEKQTGEKLPVGTAKSLARRLRRKGHDGKSYRTT